MVGNCRLKLVAVRMTPSISNSCSAVYSPSQTKTYFSTSQVWISLYLLATKRAAIPSSWKLPLLMRAGSQTSRQSTICAQMCKVSCMSWNLRPTCSSHRRRTLRMSALTAHSPLCVRATRALIWVRKARSSASMWVRMAGRQGWRGQCGRGVSSSMRVGLATGSAWLVRSVPNRRSSLLCLGFCLVGRGGFGFLALEGLFLSFMGQVGQAALLFISNLLYFKFIRCYQFGRQQYYQKKPPLLPLSDAPKINSPCLPVCKGKAQVSFQQQLLLKQKYQFVSFLLDGRRGKGGDGWDG